MLDSNPRERAIPKEWIDQRKTWRGKRVLREVYEDLFQRIAAQCLAGTVLEVGSGIGTFKESRSDVVALDVVLAPWLDMVADAQQLPIDAGSFDNIVAVDVLHHLPKPVVFLGEAQRVLRTGGRLIMLEPAITAGSWFFYRYIHQERVDLRADPFGDDPMCSEDPYDANQAIPTLLFQRRLDRFEQEMPELQLLAVEHMSVLAYPLSGGFKPWSLLPGFLTRPVLALDNVLPRVVRRTLGFRLLAVLSKQ